MNVIAAHFMDTMNIGELNRFGAGPTSDNAVRRKKPRLMRFAGGGPAGPLSLLDLLPQY